MQQGWIKLYRSIKDKGFYKDSEYVHLWVHLLLSANHEKKEIMFNGSTITLQSGQLITGRLELAKDCGISESKVERILKFFKSEQQIEQQTNSKFRLIKIKNWNDFQESEQQNEQPVDSQWTASEQPVNTNKNEKNNKNERNISSKEDMSQAQKIYGTVQKAKSYGNPEINKMLEALKVKIQISAFADSAIERNIAKHCVNLLEKIGKDAFVRRLEIILSDPFKRKNCNRIRYVYNEIKAFIEPSIKTSSSIAFIS